MPCQPPPLPVVVGEPASRRHRSSSLASRASRRPSRWTGRASLSRRRRARVAPFPRAPRKDVAVDPHAHRHVDVGFLAAGRVGDDPGNHGVPAPLAELLNQVHPRAPFSRRQLYQPRQLLTRDHVLVRDTSHREGEKRSQGEQSDRCAHASPRFHHSAPAHQAANRPPCFRPSASRSGSGQAPPADLREAVGIKAGPPRLDNDSKVNRPQPGRSDRALVLSQKVDSVQDGSPCRSKKNTISRLSGVCIAHRICQATDRPIDQPPDRSDFWVLSAFGASGASDRLTAYQKLYQAAEIRSRSAATRCTWMTRRRASETFWLM